MDVTDATFETDVLARSANATVVVDLWASWCGPCRVLGPILEKVVAETPGAELVKIDVDANPRASATFQVQSIPAVYAIRDRKVVDSFIGALPESAVRQWIAQVVPAPSEVDRLVAQGDETSLRKALDLEPANEKAILAMATFLVDQASSGDTTASEEALALLARLPDTADVHHLAAKARLAAASSNGVAASSTEGAPGLDGVEAKLDNLLERVRDDEGARQEYLDLLEVLGPDDPRTTTYRRALTSRLF